MGGLNHPRNDASHAVKRGSCSTVANPGRASISNWQACIAVLILAAGLIFATTAPAQPVNPLAVVIAQRDAAIRQRDALLVERNALRDERRETLRVCRQHGMPADADLPTWLGEVLRGGSERAEWASWFVRHSSED
jgi:hypothetical protein